MKQIHSPKDPKYRPLAGYPYKLVFLRIAEKLNETSLHQFDDLATLRHAAFELWMRVLPDEPFPPAADVMRTPYHKDPEAG